MNEYQVIIRPIITEKSNITTGLNKYTFEVDRRSNKTQVAEAVSRIFNVTVEQVRILNKAPKFGRWGRKVVVRHPAFKKAIVTVAAGQRIEFFEGV
jgi:large subunit ribosomal protein L23